MLEKRRKTIFFNDFHKGGVKMLELKNLAEIRYMNT